LAHDRFTHEMQQSAGAIADGRLIAALEATGSARERRD
jgi:hypothetical protein